MALRLATRSWVFLLHFIVWLSRVLFQSPVFLCVHSNPKCPLQQGEMFLFGCHIPEYQAGSFMAKFDPVRPKKLLLHQKQIRELVGAITREGATLVPLELLFNEKGRAKVLLGLAQGKKQHDKRADIAKRDWQRDKARVMRNKGGE